MARVAQRIGGLVENRVARHKPENHRAFGAHKIRHGQSRRMARQ
jgi:hypothetical protein